ncbi:ABC transporter substrate-binding protein [Dactylosporangium sp. CA-092794]|uniref:ABC transporter substrate-binding protein n=1 Tax=Dactylosporangium sp. CA-092794 TaxID=3239929 RepID=UPI003D8F4031
MSLRKFLGGVAISAALVVGATGCSGGGSDAPAGHQKLTIGVIVDVGSFDPSQSDVGNFMQYLQPAYDTLIRLDDKGKLQPMLATKWEYTDHENKVLELTLRQGVKFSDGTPLTAEAVIASLKRFAAANGPRATALASVASYKAVNDSTVDLTLSAPDPALTHNLALVAGMITNPAVAAADLATTPAGAGPYVLDKNATRRGDVYVFTRNENYYDTEAFPFPEIDLRVLTDPTARLNAVKTGQVDATFGEPSRKAEAKSSGLTVISAPGDWQGLFLIDRAGKTTPALGDVRVRQAINYAIDGDALLKSVAFGEGTSSTQMFYPGTPAYDDSLNRAYPFDPDKARKLLAEAGYAGGFTLKMPSIDVFLPEVYPIVKQQLANVGITVDYTPLNVAGGLGPFLTGEYPAFVFSWGSSQNWLDATLLLSKDGAWNPFHVADPKIADLMSKIAVASGDEQAALYKQLSAYVVDQAWFDPFYVVNNLFFVGPHVTVTPQAQQSVPSIYNYKPAK